MAFRIPAVAGLIEGLPAAAAVASNVDTVIDTAGKAMGLIGTAKSVFGNSERPAVPTTTKQPPVYNRYVAVTIKNNTPFMIELKGWKEADGYFIPGFNTLGPREHGSIHLRSWQHGPIKAEATFALLRVPIISEAVLDESSAAKGAAHNLVPAAFGNFVAAAAEAISGIPFTVKFKDSHERAKIKARLAQGEYLYVPSKAKEFGEMKLKITNPKTGPNTYKVSLHNHRQDEVATGQVTKGCTTIPSDHVNIRLCGSGGLSSVCIVDINAHTM